MGNLYVLINNFKYIFDPSGGKMRMDVLYYALVYILMAFTLVCSDTMFVLGVLGYSHVSLGGLSTMVWVMACALFECNVMLTLAKLIEKFAQTIVLITHNEELAQMTSRRIRIEDGSIVSDSGVSV